MPEGAARIYRFGPFALDVADRSLKRDGASISLTPKTFDLLVALVESAGRLVEKDSLLKAVWPDVAVEEGNLTKGIFSLRQLLESEGRSRFIETVPKRGYRFVAEVSIENEAPMDAVQVPTTAAPPENSIAVMPFSDMSAGRDHNRSGIDGDVASGGQCPQSRRDGQDCCAARSRSRRLQCVEWSLRSTAR